MTDYKLTKEGDRYVCIVFNKKTHIGTSSRNLPDVFEYASHKSKGHFEIEKSKFDEKEILQLEHLVKTTAIPGSK